MPTRKIHSKPDLVTHDPQPSCVAVGVVHGGEDDTTPRARFRVYLRDVDASSRARVERLLTRALGSIAVHEDPPSEGWPHPQVRIVADDHDWRDRFGAAACYDEFTRLAGTQTVDDGFLDDPALAEWTAPARALRTFWKALRHDQELHALSAIVEVPWPSERIGTGATLSGPFGFEFFHFVRVCDQLLEWGCVLERTGVGPTQAIRHIELEPKAMPTVYLRWTGSGSRGEGHPLAWLSGAPKGGSDDEATAAADGATP